MADYRMVVYGLLMMAMMIVRPQGIIDRKMFHKRR
jgi:ABC-type branched-subunit amino acid transport system permease subunit